MGWWGVVVVQFLTLTPLLFFFFLLFCHYLQAFIAGADEVVRGLAPVRVHNQMLAFGEQRGEHLHTGKGGESAVEVHCCVSVITALILPVFYSGNLKTATPFRVTLLNTQTKIALKPPRTTAHFLLLHFQTRTQIARVMCFLKGDGHYFLG